MKCPKCGTEMDKVDISDWNESYNFNNVLPKGWLKGVIRFDCPKEYTIYLRLKDGSVYAYDTPEARSGWKKITVSQRKVPKGQIIGGYFVQ